MSNNINAYEGMGSLLARLPTFISIARIDGHAISDEAQARLTSALKVAVTALIRSRQYYQLDDESVSALAAGFSFELGRIIVAASREHQPPVQTMRADDQTWELAFDPGTEGDPLRTDEHGRVWRKIPNASEDSPPF
jgi:hypothetical protein